MTALITLLTDFGHQDVYIGVMKGVMAAIAPTAQFIDLTHTLPPQDLWAARFNLLNAYPFFPPSTIHLAVVDPGVGSTRRAIAVATPQGKFVGPDNGLFSGVFAQTPILQAVALTNPVYWRTPTPSTTFHGRDIFAPAAAHLAQGTALTKLGPAIAPDSLVTLELPPLNITPDAIEGTIQYCDRFGNLVTTIPGDRLPAKTWILEVGQHKITAVTTYSDRAIGELTTLIGSHGWVEIAVNGGSAAARLGPITRVKVAWQERERK